MVMLILTLFKVYKFIILVRVILSWINVDHCNPIVRWIYKLTEPVLDPVRRLLPQMGLDLSPLIVLLVIEMLERLVVRSLLSF